MGFLHARMPEEKALSCLERVDRAQPGTGVEGTPNDEGWTSLRGEISDPRRGRCPHRPAA